MPRSLPCAGSGRTHSTGYPIYLLLAHLVLLRRSPWEGGFLLASFLFVFFPVLNYDPGGRHVFFLSTYVPCAAVVGSGIGALIDASARWKLVAERGWGRITALATALAVTAGVITPAVGARLPAIRTGVARFATERYQFPVKDLREPRRLAEMRLGALPDDALVLMKWRDLHAVAYLAHVEAKKPNLLLVQAMPRGHHGRVVASMIETIGQSACPILLSRYLGAVELRGFRP